MQYTEFHFTTPDVTTAEILLALLAEFGFDTFDHTDNELFAYIPSLNIRENDIEKQITDLQSQFIFHYTVKTYADKNWNEEWEKNFNPIIVADKVFIRAPFHAKNDSLPLEIIIEPRMSFGTGHHESTYLMIEQMLDIEFDRKIVCDAGCGTGILAIFAAMRGAAHVFAIDNNEWAYNNGIDNALLNNKKEKITFELGELDLLKEKKFDIILANINKPIIIENLPVFANCLSMHGKLLLSGILIKDLQDVITEAFKQGFQLTASKIKGDWVCATLTV